MHPRSIHVLCLVALLAANPQVSAQQSKAIPEQKAPSAETTVQKKPNILVFKLSGTPRPTPKWERPKEVPRFHPLSNADKLNIAHQVNPQISGNGTPVGRYLSLCWPDYAYLWISHFVPATDFTASPLCTTGSDNPQHVEIQFGAQVNNAYLVDFFISVVLGQVDTGQRDFKYQVSGMQPSYPTVGAGYTHLFTAFCPPSTGNYTTVLELKPKPTDNSQPGPIWGPWWFIQAEVTQFNCPPTP